MPSSEGRFLVCIAMLIALEAAAVVSTSTLVRTPEYVGNEACASCHRNIVDAYSRTAMARTSGPARSNVIEGSFEHRPSGISYRIYQEAGVPFLSYERDGTNVLRGVELLKYYVGSNTRGRTFLFSIDGFLYQSPINYYAATHVWDMSPGYQQLHEMELNHPVDRTCLFCHASRVQTPAKGTVNSFVGEPFLQPGVGCERCHGPGSEHVAGGAPMVNPARLTGARRDSICMQCHLEGAARIATAGHTEEDYIPGAMLSDSVAIFVHPDQASQGLGAVSHFEALAVSKCKERSRDNLSCITCHDPHVNVAATEKAAYYRTKCLGCHATFAEGHHSETRDCTTCHMPRIDSADIGHTMVTDHRIVRTERRDRSRQSPDEKLVEFGSHTAAPRELGLAYGEVATQGSAFAAREAVRLLEFAVHTHEQDADVLSRLGYLSQISGDEDRAQTYYDRALRADPDRAIVAADLGVLLARRGMLARALALWRDAFENNPHLTDLALNLARGLCTTGDAKGARQVVERALRHNPDSRAATGLLAALSDTACRSSVH